MMGFAIARRKTRENALMVFTLSGFLSARLPFVPFSGSGYTLEWP
jgi:hypothetical protein